MRISDWSSDVCSSDLKGRSCCHPPHCNVDRADIPLPARRLAAIVASHVTENEVSTTTADHVVALVLAGNHAQIAIDHIVATLVLELGRAHVCTPVTTSHLVCRLLLETTQYLYSSLT